MLWKWLADETADLCCTSATRDIKTVTRRFEHEGESFLTITLPNFGKDFERSLDQGYADRSLFTGFQWKGGLPRFLSGFLGLVFDRDSGVLLDEPNIDAILSVRQLTLMFGKILLPCSDAREKEAMKKFIECEQDVKEFDVNFMSDSNIRHDFRRISSMLYSSVLTEVDREIYNLNVLPKHGPGATADRLGGNAKYNLRAWTSRLEGILPYGEMCLPNWSFYDTMEEVHILEPGSEIPVRVISVPKTLKTPRIIAIEPTAMQYAQQGIMALILGALQRDDFLRNAIGFDNQVPNQDMAREGSLSGNLATLDLSEASDRVSNQLVREMLVHHPHLHGAVDASRSRKADVPGHGVIRLSKFASMGSALTFPIEAMAFLAMCFVGIERGLNTPLTPRMIKSFKGQVRVYGDDIIVPVDMVPHVVWALETFGSVVNRGKSFWTGKFRESCGKEYYDGKDVSIVRVRRTLPTQREHVQEIVSLVSLRNQLYFAGYWRTCEKIDDLIRKIIKYFPVVDRHSPVLGRHSFLGYEVQDADRDTHTPLVKGYVPVSKIPRDSLDGIGALQKWFLSAERRDVGTQKFPHLGTSADADHLERAGRPKRLDMRLGWFPSY